MTSIPYIQQENATYDDLDSIYQLESLSFPPDEAATKDSIEYRIISANPYFRVIRNGKEIISFINGTCIDMNCINVTAMKSHHPNGKNLVIHSVTVAPEYRRRGIAKSFLCDYMMYISEARKEIEVVMLLTKSSLLKFYVSCGFELVQPSDVHHGKVLLD
jgi:ribosomal protein S18 acetylase RimI-like enzyme